jgi:hypothetical protein
MRTVWIAALLLLPASSVAAQVFSHDTGRARWEAEVTADTFSLRQTRDGAVAGSEFMCPLGPALRASVMRTASDGSKVCLVFSRAKCTHKGTDEGNGAANGAESPLGGFKCVDVGTADDARRLAALINAGPPARRPVHPLGLTPAAKSSKSADRGRGL